MTSTCKFSIVTPSYNQAQFISETIESVLSQAGDFEIEYFVMDGGSTDGSVEIIKEYAGRLQSDTWPIRCAGITMEWVSQRDKGQSDAINQGLRRATGTIASYINSDDLFFPGAFARVAQEFAKHPAADLVYGDGDVIDAAGQRQWEWLSRPYDHKLMTSYHFLWNDFTNYIMQQSTFWHTRVHDQIGYFDETFHYALDAEYWIRAGHAGLKLHHTPHKLGKFRLIQGTKSLSSPTAFWEDYLEIFRRYRGISSLDRFFAYYYFNIAQYLDYDLDHTLEKGNRVFKQWESLPLDEQRAIRQKADKGFDVACLMAAHDLRRKHRRQESVDIICRSLNRRRSLLFHPTTLAYLVRVMAGVRVSSKLDLLTQKLIARYKWHRYEYRYHRR
jgi:glycosyltransferase involved in cell wall biosynthesis